MSGGEDQLRRMQTAPPILPIGRYRLHFEGLGKRGPSGFLGSAWRGAMGHALRKAVCVTRMTQCQPCLLYRSCPYPYIFETPPPANTAKMRKYTAAPHPFLLDLPFPDTEPSDGDQTLGLTLIGRGNAELPYMIHAFQKAGEEGLGRSRVPRILRSVSQEVPPGSATWTVIYDGLGLRAFPAEAPPIPEMPQIIEVCFESPLRLQRDEHLVGVRDFRFSDLFGALLRRISMLSYFHTDVPLETNFLELSRLGSAVEWEESQLEWRDWTRFSSRQKRELQMGGLIGRVSLRLEAGSPFWPYLWLGQWIHAGKGASMGLGRYSIQIPSLPKTDGRNS